MIDVNAVLASVRQVLASDAAVAGSVESPDGTLRIYGRTAPSATDYPYVLIQSPELRAEDVQERDLFEATLALEVVHRPGRQATGSAADEASDLTDACARALNLAVLSDGQVRDCVLAATALAQVERRNEREYVGRAVFDLVLEG